MTRLKELCGQRFADRDVSTDAALASQRLMIHEDGAEDALSQYSGDTQPPGSAERQEYRADAFSHQLFLTRGNPASVTNVWAMEVTDTLFAYELRRPQRFFRVEFDLARAVEN